jgi:hypothetical protein
VIPLLLVRVANKRARAAGFKHGAERMMDLLSSINTALVFYPKSMKQHRFLCSLTPDQNELLTQLKCEIPKVR